MKRSSKTTRRGFLRRSAAIGAGGLAAPYFVPAHLLGGPGRTAANDRVHVGVIGTGIRGKYLIANMPREGRVVALCDSSLARVGSTLEPAGEFAAPLAEFRQQDAPAASTWQDYRRMIDAAKLDAVMIAAPDHHHVLAAMLACQAGLDVYLEKPLSLSIAEGRALAHAVRRYDRVLQVGSQQRTMEFNRFACEFVRDGRLGKVSLVELPNYPGPMASGGFAQEPVPPDLDWNLFCGPTELVAYNRKLWVKDEFRLDGRLWRGWDLYQAFSGHLMTNWGAHSVDMVQFALGMDAGGPVEIRPLTADLDPALDRQWLAMTPPLGAAGNADDDRMRFCPVTMRYASGVELRFTPAVKDAAVFHGQRGRLLMRRNYFQTDPPELASGGPDPALKQRWDGPGHVARPHIQNWLDCVRARRRPNAPVEVGHRTATVCHLANLARRLRRRLRWDPEREQFVGDDTANRLLDRPRRKGFELPDVT